jgi:hypothetical protein
MAELSMYAEQIKALHLGGASVEDIATGMEITVEEVRTVLIHTSPKFRAQSFAAPAGMSLEDEMLQIAAQIARSSDMDMVRLSAAKYVRDDCKGRRDLVPADAGMNTTALAELQAGLTVARQRRLEFLKGKNAIIELPGGTELSDRADSRESDPPSEQRRPTPEPQSVPAGGSEG